MGSFVPAYWKVISQAGTIYHSRGNGTYGCQKSEPCGLLQFPAELLGCILEHEAFAGEGEQTEAGCGSGEKLHDSLG